MTPRQVSSTRVTSSTAEPNDTDSGSLGTQVVEFTLWNRESSDTNSSDPSCCDRIKGTSFLKTCGGDLASNRGRIAFRGEDENHGTQGTDFASQNVDRENPWGRSCSNSSQFLRAGRIERLQQACCFQRS